jgi:hypothetical protein
MKTIVEALTIKLYARYFFLKEKLEEKREPQKGELHEIYVKILKKLIHESHLELNDFSHYLAETKKCWASKLSDEDLEKKRISQRTSLVEMEKEEIRNVENWNIYMNSLINIPIKTNLIEIRNVEEIAKQHPTPVENIKNNSIELNSVQLALENIKNIGGPDCAHPDILSEYEFDLAKRIEHDFELPEEEFPIQPIPRQMERVSKWIQMNLF